MSGHCEGGLVAVAPTVVANQWHAVATRPVRRGEAAAVDQFVLRAVVVRWVQGKRSGCPWAGLGTEGEQGQDLVGLVQRGAAVLAGCGLHDLD